MYWRIDALSCHRLISFNCAQETRPRLSLKTRRFVNNLLIIFEPHAHPLADVCGSHRRARMNLIVLPHPFFFPPPRACDSYVALIRAQTETDANLR